MIESVQYLTLADFDPTLKRLTCGARAAKNTLSRLRGQLAGIAKIGWGYVGIMFYAVNKGGRIIERAITRKAIFKVCSKWALEVKIPDFSPHDFRCAFVGDLLDAGADIVTVKDLAGHATVQTMARYNRWGQERLHHAMELLNTPYSGRKQRDYSDLL